MEALVDSFLAERYSLPLPDVPQLIVKITKDLTAYEVLRSQYVNDNQNQNTWVLNYREDALNLLKLIKDGRISLVHSHTVIQPISNILIKTNLSNKPLAVNMDSELDWRVSKSLLDNVETEREGAD